MHEKNAHGLVHMTVTHKKRGDCMGWAAMLTSPYTSLLIVFFFLRLSAVRKKSVTRDFHRKLLASLSSEDLACQVGYYYYYYGTGLVCVCAGVK